MASSRFAVQATLLVLLPALASSFSLLPATPLAAARIVHTGSSRRVQHASVVMAKKGGSAKAKGGFGASGGAKGGFAATKQAPKEATAAAPPAAAGMPEVEKFDLGDGTMFMGAYVIKDESVSRLLDFRGTSVGFKTQVPEPSQVQCWGDHTVAAFPPSFSLSIALLPSAQIVHFPPSSPRRSPSC